MKQTHNAYKITLLGVLLFIFVISLFVLILGLNSTYNTNAATVGISKISMSLGEDIVVKFTTDAETDDGSYLEVVLNDKTTKIEKHINGVFAFKGISPQHMSNEFKATLKSANGTTIGSPVTESIKGYLEDVLSLSKEESGAATTMQFTAMQELAVNLLNYGAAAQVYTNYNTKNLANADLTEKQIALSTENIAVAKSDKSTTGDAFVGAGVRFDYKLGLYFVFKAENVSGLTLKINGVNTDYNPYKLENHYIAYYNDFCATDMNKSVTAVLNNINGELASMTYSVNAYVNSKGSGTSKLAKLVNATYAYGFAAVAYSNVTINAPSINQEGCISISDSCGYDYNQTKYSPINLPSLNANDYNAVTTQTSNTGKELAYTTFTHKTEDVSFDVKVDSVLLFNSNVYSQYDIENASLDGVTATYSNNRYNIIANNSVTVDNIQSFGAPLTLIGDYVTNSKMDVFSGVNFGTETKACNFTINTDTDALLVESYANVVNGTLTINTTSFDNSAIVVNPGNLIVEEQGKIVTTGDWAYSIYISSDFGTSNLTVNGTIEANSEICAMGSDCTVIIDNGGIINCSAQFTVEGSAIENENAEYALSNGKKYDHRLFIKNGTLNITTGGLTVTSMQVGSTKHNTQGNLTVYNTNNVITKGSGTGGYVFANGSVTVKASAKTKSGIIINDKSGNLDIYLLPAVKFTANTVAYAFDFCTEGNLFIHKNAFDNITATNVNTASNKGFFKFIASTTLFLIDEVKTTVNEGDITALANVLVFYEIAFSRNTVMNLNNALLTFPTADSYDMYEFISWVE